MLEVQGVTKVYGSHKAVDNISFKTGDHGIVGFLGPNGAGKSTTMNIITGYTSSNQGTVAINGCEVLEDPIRYKGYIGYLPERPPLYPDMTVRSYLSFIFDLKKIRLPKKAHIDEICAAVAIGAVEKRIIKNLSKGYQQRVGLAQAMLGKPEVLILDEPTVGLDPKQILEIRNLIKELGKTCTVIFSSHILQEVQSVCERIIIINNGVLIADGSPEDLAARTSGDASLILAAEGPEADIREALGRIPHVRNVEGKNAAAGEWEFVLESESGFDIRRDLFAVMSRNGWPILGLRRGSMTLENVFLRLVAGDTSVFQGLERKPGSGAEEKSGVTPDETEATEGSV
ncbi:MAG: ABC transporter ATP-binding protein [Treponema sp.]|nr:ABC transporter ATP-binding protein [Treponema sp.]